jgi:hypothetical protein
MPVQLFKSRSSGAIKWRNTCDVCGADAIHAVGCFPGIGLKLIMDGKREEGYAKLGKWYCADHIQSRPQPEPVQGALL